MQKTEQSWGRGGRGGGGGGEGGRAPQLGKHCKAALDPFLGIQNMKNYRINLFAFCCVKFLTRISKFIPLE